jgi:hypothetical protein
MARRFNFDFNRFGYYGSYSSGVISYADMNANEEGYKFYENVYESYKKGEKYVFSVNDYNTASFNEAQNSPSRFSRGLVVDDSRGMP